MSQPAAVARLLEAQFNHIVLPARVPTKRDDNLAALETALTDRFVDASRVLRDCAEGDCYFDWDNVRRVLLSVKSINLGGKLDKRSLTLELGRLQYGDLLILHVAEQNAGLLIHRLQADHGQEVLFEAFEASPRSEDVLATEHALQWDFPGSAVAVPYTILADESFQDSLTAFLEQCSTESIKRFAARANKAGSLAIETRDTVDPAMISSLLMTLLEVHGRRVFGPVLRKRIRDNVCWGDGTWQ
ncbi:hypothetical protein UCRNP2_7664 [Neofusicoccum parvum UCRNP2]|uniref:DUF6606 domain-containing protein n=1 Tax=Botryosphaeria parva (strain UCR-NP2) TaxID=1287680 RepID=R1GBP3_BOTPV|nr:hypothetical protein UCRNP2_7664 [Neofusicoccum parvum UCRNP2]